MSAIGRQAVVIGAGMGGLAASGALAPWFDKVTVVERDALPEEPAQRLGALQGRHVHALLAGGQRALESLFPGFVEEITAAGAVAVRANADVRFEAVGVESWPQRDFGWVTYCVSRPLLEFVVRSMAARAGVEFRPRSRVLGLEAGADGGAIAAVQVEYDGGRTERLAADLVIDASGRAGPTLKLLKALGRPSPEEIVIGVDFAYASAVFEIPDDAPADWKVLLTSPSVPASSRGALLAPMEHGQWILSVGGRQDEVPPEDPDAFLEFVRGLRTSTVYDAIKGATRVGDIARYGFRESLWRRFDRGTPPPRGLIPFADSIARFNPVYG
ncbi:MAG TPA: FAD-dependent oxidoreductase, partial [Caulobacteraceae bacterium]